LANDSVGPSQDEDLDEGDLTDDLGEEDMIVSGQGLHTVEPSWLTIDDKGVVIKW
jgi:hypothetical protein